MEKAYVGTDLMEHINDLHIAIASISAPYDSHEKYFFIFIHPVFAYFFGHLWNFVSALMSVWFPFERGLWKQQ